jgi:hypothetical protein
VALFVEPVFIRVSSDGDDQLGEYQIRYTAAF